MQNLTDVGRRKKGLRRVGIFRYFSVPSIYLFLYTCPRLQVTPEDLSQLFMLKTRVSA